MAEKKRGVPLTDSAAVMFAAKSKTSVYTVLICSAAVLFAEIVKGVYTSDLLGGNAVCS